jgi:hypothetical protein
MGTLSTSRSQRRINTVPTDPDDNRVLECAGSQTRSLDDDVLVTNPKYDWKRFGDYFDSGPDQFSSVC